ncbi:PrgI family protein [Candidatus Saccharibacteria bacterium]|nr:PrgI family protein [Candidatus Saccharibacteria bacterium]
MATYKVLQDIEAEDKLLGPFTLKQFIFAGITIVIGWIGFMILASGAPMFIIMPLLLVLLPFFLLFGFLAAPIGRDQSTETWLLARLRFLFKPRLRIWSQDGVSELVTITVPKKEEKILTKSFSQDEVHSRLQALANTVDSRGWAVKNVNTNLFNQPSYIQDQANTGSDRLVDPSNIPQDVPVIDVLASDDMLDPLNNTTAQHLNQLMDESSTAYHQQLVESVSTPPLEPTAPPVDYYFMNQNNDPTLPTPSGYTTFTDQSVVAPGTIANLATNAEETPEELALAHSIAEKNKKSKEFMTNHGMILQPLHDQDGNIIPRPTEPTAVDYTAPEPQNTNSAVEQIQDPVNSDIIGLAGNNDWSVDTIARQAKEIKQAEQDSDGEVVISLH